MGDKDRADDGRSIPSWFESAKPQHNSWTGRADRFLSMPVYYELINDNLHDVSHVEFVHPETLGTTVIPQMYRMRDSEFTDQCNAPKEFGEREMRLDSHAQDIQGSPVLHQMIAYQRRSNEWTDNIDWELTLRYATPSQFLFNHRTKAVGENDSAAIQIASLHTITPETDAGSHYFFHTAHNLTDTAERQEEFTDTCADALVFAFHQDKTLNCRTDETRTAWRSRLGRPRASIVLGRYHADAWAENDPKSNSCRARVRKLILKAG